MTCKLWLAAYRLRSELQHAQHDHQLYMQPLTDDDDCVGVLQVEESEEGCAEEAGRRSHC